MKKLILILLLITNSLQCLSQKFITSDIGNFWKAYDKIVSTKDSVLQYTYLNTLYFDKGSYGLKAIREVRDYTAKDYIDAINNYPLFWESIRENTLKAAVLAKEIEYGVKQLKVIYPELKPATVYFTIGAFRTNGTTLDSSVLIGSELALADANTNISELPNQFSHLKPYFASNPINGVTFLNIHEFVHTQQKNHDYVLLYRSVYEGIAEFVAVKAMGQASTAPAIAYGYANEQLVKTKFSNVMYSGLAISQWLYNSTNNEFKTRDLGYYVGYAIAEKYYNKTKDKQKAIKTLIELDYSNEKQFEGVVDGSGYFVLPLKVLKQNYLKNQPKIIAIKEFTNGSSNVDPNTKQISVTFSHPMNPNQRGFEFGPLGETNALMIKKFNGFSDDKKTMTFEVALEANKKYQLEITDKFRSLDGVPLVPYLIDIKTK